MSFLNVFTSYLRLVFAVICIAFPQLVMGNCSWTSSAGAVFIQSEIQFYDLARWLSKALWVDDPRYPASTLMALSTVSLRPEMCTGLLDLRTRLVDFVYVPPPNAIRSDGSYLIPSNAPGVALRLEFLPATGLHPNGALISTTTAPVSPGGVLPAAYVPQLNMRAAVIKTADFGPHRFDSSPGNIFWPNGLGWIRYFVVGIPDTHAADQVALVMGPLAAEATGHPGRAVAASCRLAPAFTQGRLGGHREIRSDNNVVALGAVSSTDFSGVGEIEKGAKGALLAFQCVARGANAAKVSFDASYPFNAGINGVGLPAPDSDIGVQVLLEGVPVQLGEYSKQLRWHFQPSSGYSEQLPGRSVQGRFCTAGCGDDTSLANPSWIEGDGGTANNTTMEAQITFKYFQTTQQPPQPRSFSVPFIVTLDLH